MSIYIPTNSAGGFLLLHTFPNIIICRFVVEGALWWPRGVGWGYGRKVQEERDICLHMAPHSSTRLENPRDGGAWWAAVHGVAKSRARLSNFTFTFHFSCIGELNGNPLQCSCLENPKDGGAWWAAVSGVAQSWTGLKWLSSSSSWFQGGAVVKNLPANSRDPRDTGLIPGLGSPAVENHNPLQYSLLENLMDRGAWCATIYGFPTSMGSQRVGDNWAHAHSWFISLLSRN